MEDNTEKTSNGNKKPQLEELDRDELVKRCKSYLALAQRAKLARDDAQQRETDLLNKISNLEDCISHLSEENASFINQVEQTKEENLSLLSQLQTSVPQLKLKEEENNSLISLSEEMQTKLKNLEENYGQQKDGFVEELNKMNDVLKQRGEAITRLEEKCQTNEKEFKTKTETLLQLVAERERKIEQLENDLNRLETQSEIMSTSTVSKAEEFHRMKDVEDSLEERYNKLKMLAVKMKRKIAEQNVQLQEKENQLASFTQADKLIVKNIPANLQAAQKEIDRLNDELDSRKSEITLLKKDCTNAIQELATSKQRAEEFKSEVSCLKSSLTNVEKLKKALENSVQELKIQLDDQRKESESEKILRIESSKECDRLKNEIRQLNCTVDEFNKKNLVIKQESKKQSLLELELTDYEKSLSELNAQLDSLQKELKLKQNLIDQTKEENSSLKAHVKLLEQQINTDNARKEDFEANLKAALQQLEACQVEGQQQKNEIHQLTAKVEFKDGEVNNLKLQLSTVNAELHKVQTTSSAHIETLRKQIARFEESMNAVQSDKDSLQVQLSELRAEYENYKIRATSVLKKQKTEGQSSTIATKEPVDGLNTDQIEREMLQRIVEALKTKIGELESQLALSQTEVSTLRVEKERTAATQASVITAMQQRLEHAETEMEVVKREHQTQLARLNGDNQLLASLHREQIDGLKLRHAQEILELESKMDEAEKEISKWQVIASASHNHSRRSASPQFKASDQKREEMAFVERERGEGSEDGSISRHRREGSNGDKRQPIPLELLLNTPLASDETFTFQQEPESIPYEQYSEALASVEKRCNHLAALLAESEANEARLSQLADALKEEIRRTERAEERQKHIENLEYLKNVVLKFITLPRGEERSRLVPVLTTLLRLSPLEVQDVNQSFNRGSDGVARPIAWGGVFNYFAPNQ